MSACSRQRLERSDGDCSVLQRHSGKYTAKKGDNTCSNTPDFKQQPINHGANANSLEQSGPARGEFVSEIGAIDSKNPTRQINEYSFMELSGEGLARHDPSTEDKENEEPPATGLSQLLSKFHSLPRVRVFPSESTATPGPHPMANTWKVRHLDNARRSDIFVDDGTGTEAGKALFCLKLPFDRLISMATNKLVHWVQREGGRKEVMLEGSLRTYLRVGSNCDEYNYTPGKMAMLKCGKELSGGGMCILGVVTSIRCRFREIFYTVFGDCANYSRILLESNWECPRPRRFVANVETLDSICQELISGENRLQPLAGYLVERGTAVRFDADYTAGDPVEDAVIDCCLDCTLGDDAVFVFVVFPAILGRVCIMRNGRFAFPQAHEVRRVLLGCCQAVQGMTVNGRRVALVMKCLDGRVCYAVDLGGGWLEIMESYELFPPV